MATYGRWSLTKCGRLRDVPSMVILVQNFWCFGSVVTYGRWSFTRGSEYGNLSGKCLVF